jgi:hypothetical protein
MPAKSFVDFGSQLPTGSTSLLSVRIRVIRTSVPEATPLVQQQATELQMLAVAEAASLATAVSNSPRAAATATAASSTTQLREQIHHLAQQGDLHPLLREVTGAEKSQGASPQRRRLTDKTRMDHFSPWRESPS